MFTRRLHTILMQLLNILYYIYSMDGAKMEAELINPWAGRLATTLFHFAFPDMPKAHYSCSRKAFYFDSACFEGHVDERRQIEPDT